MTLLEAVAALTILGLSAMGFLAGFDGAARAARRADRVAQLVATADATLEEAIARGASGDALAPLAAGFTRRIDVRPWRRDGLAELTVTVRDAEGDSVQLRRLVRAP